MTNNFPQPGQVFEYHYLWAWQKAHGETEGRKSRPCCVAIILRSQDGEHILFIVPITTKTPENGRHALKVPQIEARRAGLATDTPLWVMVDEINADVLERSVVLEDRTLRGMFGPKFLKEIVQGIQAVRAAKALKVSSRT